MVTIGAPIFVTANKGPTPLLVVSKGSEFRLLGAEGEWYRVEFDDPRWGKRVGFVEKRHAIATTEAVELGPVDLSIHDSNSEALEPIDLSIREPVARSIDTSGTLTVTIVGAQDTSEPPGFVGGQ